MKAAITSTGRYFPAREVPNSYFYEDLGLDTTEEWIQSRTGIDTRRLADSDKGETASTMAIAAARICLDRAGISAKDIDCIVVATVTPDRPLPATACLVQDGLGADCWGFDLHAACSGFVYGLDVASSMVESGRSKRVLLIGVDHMSSILDFTDRNTCIIFGDGAGAVLVESVPDENAGGISRSYLHADGSGATHLYIPAGGGLEPITSQNLKENRQFVRQEGRIVFKHAVSKICSVIKECLAGEGLSAEDIDLFVPHQANIRIIRAAMDKMGVPREKVVVTVREYANTTAATIPTSLDLAREAGDVKKGMKILFATFGAGFTWGAQIVTWGLDD